MTGQGRPWGDHPAVPVLRHRPVLPARLPGQPGRGLDPGARRVEAKLKAGAKVADIGCGHGSSTVLMAQAYPELDDPRHRLPRPVDRGGEGEGGRGGRDQRQFEVAQGAGLRRREATTSPASSMRCTTWAIRWAPRGTSARRSMRAVPSCWSSRWPATHGREHAPARADLLRVLDYVCTPNSLSQEVGLGLGAQAGEKRLTEVVREAGFTSVRRAAETATNMVLEVTG